MSFPSNPTNGQSATVNYVTYIYDATLGVWTNQGSVASASPVASVAGRTGVVVLSPADLGPGTMTQPITLGSTLTVSGTATFNSAVTLNASAVPGVTNSYDLGSATNRWRNLYINDLQLSNGIGDYTIVEGEEDLFLYNNKSKKVFKFALIEVDPASAPPKAKTD
jgi:hypothetical protein